MGTFDTRGGSPISPKDDSSDPSKLVEDVLGLLEDAGIATEINDKIVALIEEGEFKASGAKFEPTGKKINRQCPHCTCELTIFAGESLSHERPGSGDVVYCEHCGHEESPTDADLTVLGVPA